MGCFNYFVIRKVLKTPSLRKQQRVRMLGEERVNIHPRMHIDSGKYAFVLNFYIFSSYFCKKHFTKHSFFDIMFDNL